MSDGNNEGPDRPRSDQPAPAFWISFGTAGIALVAVALFRFQGEADRLYFLLNIALGASVAALPWVSALKVKGLFEVERAVERVKEEANVRIEETSRRFDDRLTMLQINLSSQFTSLQSQVTQQLNSQSSILTNAPTINLSVAAGPGEDTSTIPRSQMEEMQPHVVLSDAEQNRKLNGIAIDFESVVSRNPTERSKFVEEIRDAFKEGWSWDFLRSKLDSDDVTVRFSAASLIMMPSVHIEPTIVARHIVRESSSLVRYRLVEALLPWATSTPTEDPSRLEVKTTLEKHVEDNVYVARKIEQLFRVVSL